MMKLIIYLSLCLIVLNPIKSQAGITMSFKDQAQTSYVTRDIYLIDLRLSHLLIECTSGNIAKKFIVIYELFMDSYSMIYDKKLISKIDEKVLPHLKMAYDLSKANQGNSDIKPYIYKAWDGFKEVKKDYAMGSSFYAGSEPVVKEVE